MKLPVITGFLFLVAIFHGVLAFNASATTYYVNAGNSAPVSPYTSWLTAATNIQDAVAQTANGDTVLVTNGVYAFGGVTAMGGVLTNRIAISNAVTVESVNGPWATAIVGEGMTNGNQAIRC
ncbi:MAG TPA: hypothetical protein VNU95_07600, partial [Candidatus Acidoferrales bacterium]|nr:hypothetical protein [Candidatus Acidoferrales bacterium]